MDLTLEDEMNFSSNWHTDVGGPRENWQSRETVASVRARLSTESNTRHNKDDINLQQGMALDFLAGCIGGVAGVVVGYPLDTIKVHLQIQDPKKPKFRGTWHCFMTIVRQESAKGLFKGMSSPLVGVAMINAITFGTYGNVSKALPIEWSSTVGVFVAGATAGLVQSVIVGPMELAKTRMQIQQDGRSRPSRRQNTRQTRPLFRPIYDSPLDCLMQIRQSDGWRGVFRGYGVTAAREIPAFGLYFATYEGLCRAMQDDVSGSVGPLAILLAGGFSGIVSWVCTYPLDVVKTRVQTDGFLRPRQYKGAVDCFVKSYRNDGITTFGRGITSTILRAFPTNAATFLAVSFTFQLLAPKLKDGDKVKVTIEASLDPEMGGGSGGRRSHWALPFHDEIAYAEVTLW